MKTKIIATIGPSSNQTDILSQLIEAGVRIFRLNFSHGDRTTFTNLIATIRTLEQLFHIPITIMQDLSGPKIRIGLLPGNTSISVTKGDLLYLGPTEKKKELYPYIPFDHKEVLAELETHDEIILADGTLQFCVKEQYPDNTFLIMAQSSGIITSRKGLSLPGKNIKLSAITEKDKNDLMDGLKLGVNAVAVSYVQTPEDIYEVKRIIRDNGYDIPVIAKLERRNALNHLDEILKETDIIMVARGDLGIECPLPELPTIQKRIIKACNKASKPVIVATQMLLSMVTNPIPTRAETTDVANAVLDGADCVMLSEETAIGNYPVETVKFMEEITTKAEELMSEDQHIKRPEESKTTAKFLAYAACLLAEKDSAKAIVTHTMTGTAARHLSACKPPQPIYALTPNISSLKRLNFSWGVIPQYLPETSEGHLTRTEKFIEISKLFKHNDNVVITAGQSSAPSINQSKFRGTNLVKIYRK